MISDSHVIIILGSPNTNEGVLLPMALGRLNKAITLYKEKISKIIITGGFGHHFNTTDYPHAFYAQKYLIENGVNKDDIQEFALSCDTVDDAKKSLPIISKLKLPFCVITSDFHVERAKYIFESVFNKENIYFFFDDYSKKISRYERKVLFDHEIRELNNLKKEGRSLLMDIKL